MNKEDQIFQILEDMKCEISRLESDVAGLKSDVADMKSQMATKKDLQEATEKTVKKISNIIRARTKSRAVADRLSRPLTE